MWKLGTLLMAAAAISLTGREASAQVPSVPSGVSNPAYSPWLNLTRPGGSSAQNYFGLVRPNFDINQSVVGLQGAVTANSGQISGIQYYGTGVGGMMTGHTTMFMNYGGYFMNHGTGTSTGNSRLGGVSGMGSSNGRLGTAGTTGLSGGQGIGAQGIGAQGIGGAGALPGNIR